MAQASDPNSSADVRYAKTVVMPQAMEADPAESVDDAPGEVGARRFADLAMPWMLSGMMHLAIVLLVLFVGVMVTVVEEEQADDQITPPKVDVDFRVRNELTPSPPLPIKQFDQPANVTPPPSKRTDPIQADPLSTIGAAGPMHFDNPQDKAQTLNLKGQDNWFDNRVGTGPPSTTRPPGGGPISIVYLIDASGSMIDQLGRVQMELIDAMHRLPRGDRFAVLFFQDDQVIELRPAGLKPVSKQNIEAASAWVNPLSGNIVPRGSSNPVPALRRALGMMPDEVWLLSDNITGRGRHALEADELLNAVDSLLERQGGRQTRINTIQFVSADPHGTLQQLARRTGGVYRFVGESDL